MGITRALFAAEPPYRLDAIDLPTAMKVLVLAPHPDDFDAIGVTLRILRDNGNPILLAVVTSGASGVEDGYRLAAPTSGNRGAEDGYRLAAPTSGSRGAEDGYRLTAPTTGSHGVVGTFSEAVARKSKSEIREREQLESCALFGLPEERVSFLRLHEDEQGHPHDDRDNRRAVRDCIREARPDAVFLPHDNDTNAGHRRTYSMFAAATASLKLTLTAFLNRDPKTIAMRHDAYTFFGEQEARWKAKLLRCHDTQQQRNLATRGHGLDDRILGVNRQTAADYRGPAPSPLEPSSADAVNRASLRLGLAEAFEIESWVDGRRRRSARESGEVIRRASS